MKLNLTQTRHRFDSARDAIDAASAFEASILTDVQYDIRLGTRGWTVELRDAQNLSLGFLAPAP